MSTAAVATGGWAQALGIDPATPVDQAIITRILDYAERRLRLPRDQGGIDPTPGLFNPVLEQTIRDWRASTENALRRYLGAAIASVPNNLATLAPQGDIFGQGTVLGGLGADILGGLGDAIGRGVLLAAILGIVLLGGWRIVSPAGRTVIVQQLRRAT